MANEENIVVTEAERLDALKPDPGVSEDVVTSPHGNTEKIVLDYDEDGNLIGWHKEPVEESK